MTSPNMRGTTPTRTPTKRRVAANIKVEMTRFGLLQSDIGVLLNLSQASVSERTRAATAFTLDELDILARRFGMETSELIDGRTTPPPEADLKVNSGCESNVIQLPFDRPMEADLDLAA